MDTVALIIPTLPERSELLAQALQSAARQERPADLLLVGTDTAREGPAAVRNRLAAKATGATWLAFLDDDDLLYPNHLRVLLEHAHGADVVYSRGARDLDGTVAGGTVGANHGTMARFHWSPSVPAPGDLDLGNHIPVTALVRADTFWDVGGFSPGDRYEDWMLWRRMLAAGAAFRPVDVETWVYRSGDWPCRTDTPDGTVPETRPAPEVVL